MSSLLIDGASRSEPVFGAGGLAPYERALLAAHRRSTLRLVGALENSPAGGDVIDVATYSDGADTVDRSVLAMTSGAVLDLGCGPGRMVEAAVQLGRTALGVDLSVAALELAVRRGVPVLHASVFDPLPDEGGWGAVLLLDGNVGIGEIRIRSSDVRAPWSDLIGRHGSWSKRIGRSTTVASRRCLSTTTDAGARPSPGRSSAHEPS